MTPDAMKPAKMVRTCASIAVVRSSDVGSGVPTGGACIAGSHSTKPGSAYAERSTSVERALASDGDSEGRRDERADRGADVGAVGDSGEAGRVAVGGACGEVRGEADPREEDG